MLLISCDIPALGVWMFFNVYTIEGGGQAPEKPVAGRTGLELPRVSAGCLTSDMMTPVPVGERLRVSRENRTAKTHSVAGTNLDSSTSRT